MKSIESEIISRLRWPLMALVVLIHSDVVQVVDYKWGGQILAPEVYPIYGFIRYFLCDVVGRIAVPVFFLISGFLFFRWTNDFSLAVYKKKIFRRIQSLLVPYIFWNTIYILAFIVLGVFSKDSAFDIYRQFDLMTILKQLRIAPPCFQFWFLRDLMVMCLCTLFMEPIIKRMKIIAPAILLIMWLGKMWPSVPGFSPQSCTFFLLGAYVGIHRVELPEKIRKPSGKILAILLVVYVVLGLIETYLCDTIISDYLHNFNIVVGMTVCLELTAYSVNKSVFNIPSYITASSFFIYGYHGLFVKMLRNFILPIVKPCSDMSFLGIFAIDFIVTISLGVFLYHLANRMIPRTTALFCGGR